MYNNSPTLLYRPSYPLSNINSPEWLDYFIGFIHKVNCTISTAYQKAFAVFLPSDLLRQDHDRTPLLFQYSLNSSAVETKNIYIIYIFTGPDVSGVTAKRCKSHKPENVFLASNCVPLMHLYLLFNTFILWLHLEALLLSCLTLVCLTQSSRMSTSIVS